MGNLLETAGSVRNPGPGMLDYSKFPVDEYLNSPIVFTADR